MTEKENHIPPLPYLEISIMTRKVVDQETVDRVLNYMYATRPDFFVRCAERERRAEERRERGEASTGGPRDEFATELGAFLQVEIGKQFKIADSDIVTELFWEIRRRSRLMYNMSI